MTTSWSVRPRSSAQRVAVFVILSSRTDVKVALIVPKT